MLLQRMVADNVRFSPQAVARLANYGFTRGEPAAAYALFKVRSAGLLGGTVALVLGALWRARWLALLRIEACCCHPYSRPSSAPVDPIASPSQPSGCPTTAPRAESAGHGLAEPGATARHGAWQ